MTIRGGLNMAKGSVRKKGKNGITDFISKTKMDDMYKRNMWGQKVNLKPKNYYVKRWKTMKRKTSYHQTQTSH